MSDKHLVTSEDGRELRDKRREKDILREEMIDKFVKGEITLEQMVALSQVSKYSHLRRIKASKLIASLPGWDEQSVERAMVVHGINIKTSIGGLAKSKHIIKSLSLIASSNKDITSLRLKGPKGFPWKGNILKCLEQLREDQIPLELREAVRFRFDTDPMFSNSQDLKEDEEKDSEEALEERKAEPQKEEEKSSSSEDELEELFSNYEDDDSEGVEEDNEDEEDDDDGLDYLLGGSDDHNYEDEDDDDDDEFDFLDSSKSKKDFSKFVPLDDDDDDDLFD